MDDLDLSLGSAIPLWSPAGRSHRQRIRPAPPSGAAAGSSVVWKYRAGARAKLASSLRGLRRDFRNRIAQTCAASDRRQPQVSRPILFGLDGLVSLEKPHQRCPLSKAHRHAGFVSYPTFVDEILPARRLRRHTGQSFRNSASTIFACWETMRARIDPIR